jgi:hypothetical protein
MALFNVPTFLPVASLSAGGSAGADQRLGPVRVCGELLAAGLLPLSLLVLAAGVLPPPLLLLAAGLLPPPLLLLAAGVLPPPLLVLEETLAAGVGELSAWLVSRGV